MTRFGVEAYPREGKVHCARRGFELFAGWIFFVLLTPYRIAWAEEPTSQTPSVAAVPARTAITVDGVLDEEAWSAASEATGFTDHKTDRPAVEQTHVRVLYDDHYLYIGFECEEPEPSLIQATERKDDRFLDADDWIEVQLDTFHDHRNVYVFITNTLGTRFDARTGLSGMMTSTWDCEWEVACTVGEDRWFAELAIPIGELHFKRGPNETWGVNFHREEKGLQEESTWSYRAGSRSSYAVSEAGQLTGLNLENARVDRNPLWEPYISATVPFDDKTEMSTGVDVTLRLSPQLTTAFTVNPDFGQIEADADTIELMDTERFLPEHRPFFREGAELFDTPIDAYYSRRFVDIEAGAKITGVGPNWTFGFLDILGEVSQPDVNREGNFSVGRYTHNIGAQSHVGAMWLLSERDDGTFNYVAGLDSRLWLNPDTSFYVQGLGLEGSERVEWVDQYGYVHEDVEDRDGYGVTGVLRGGGRPITWGVEWVDITEDFNPDLGFIRRKDIRGPEFNLEYRDDFESGIVKKASIELDFDFYENHAGETVLRDFEEWFGVTFRNEVGVYIGRTDNYHRPYTNTATTLWLSYNEVDEWHSISGKYEHGVFEEVPYDEVSLQKPTALSDRLTTELEGSIRREEQEYGTEHVWLWRWVTEYTFRNDARLKFTAEDTSEDRYNVTCLYSWPVHDNMDFHLVFSYSRSGPDEDLDRGLFSKVVYRF